MASDETHVPVFSVFHQKFKTDPIASQLLTWTASNIQEASQELHKKIDAAGKGFTRPPYWLDTEYTTTHPLTWQSLPYWEGQPDIEQANIPPSSYPLTIAQTSYREKAPYQSLGKGTPTQYVYGSS